MTTKALVRLDPDDVARRLGIAPEPVTAADMAWMAGVIDLKGSVGRKSNKTRRTPQVVLRVQCKDERIAARLSAMTGTVPEEYATRLAEDFLRRNCLEHCTVPHVHVGSDYPWQMPATTRWTLTGIAAAVVLANLAPYMTTYADCAQEVAEIVGGFTASGPGSGMIRKTLIRLQALGWQIPDPVTARLAGGGRE